MVGLVVSLRMFRVGYDFPLVHILTLGYSIAIEMTVTCVIRTKGFEHKE